METVMVLPLYMVLLGGICWTGELILAKQKLVMADRYAAWNAGNRHRMDKGGIRGEIQSKYFNMAEVGEETVYEIVHEAWDRAKWSNPIGATVLLVMRMPAWTKGWLAGSPTWVGTKPPPEQEYQQGRNAPGQRSQHVVFMRNLFGDYAYRSPHWTPKQLADWSMPWEFYVCQEEWPKVSYLHDMAPQELIYPVTPGAPAGYKYTRHGAYVDWSH